MPGPSPRELPIVVADHLRGGVLLVGGIVAPGSVVADFWRWNEGAWEALTAPAQLTRRAASAAAYDRARDRVVVFGGFDGSTSLGDTWEWDGVAWVDVTPAGPGPQPRIQHSMAYDAERSRVVLHGGRIGSVVLNDVWEWDGQVWSQVSEPQSPGRWSHGMAYDEARNELVVTGGVHDLDGTSAVAVDIRGADGWRVSERPLSAEGARFGFPMTYDPLRRTVLRFGGVSPEAGGVKPFADVWEWTGRSWRRDEELGAQPPSTPWLRQAHGMAYDARSGSPMMFGGVVGGLLPNSPRHYLDDTVVRETVGVPAYQLTHVLDGVPPSSVRRVVVRASCGEANVVAFDGTEWMEIEDHWTSSTESEARAIAAAGRVDVQCRPAAADRTSVELDYLESRVLYVR
jgi:hypothetical protein